MNEARRWHASAKVGGRIAPEQIETFKQDGFLVVRSMFDAGAVADISAWTDEIATYPEIPGRYMMYFEESRLEPGRRILSRMENFYPYHAGFARLFDSDELREGIGQLFGEEAVLFKDKVNFKLSGGDGFKPHQDVQAGWNRYASLYISVLVCIDEATIENGCIEIASGFHNCGMVGTAWAPLSDVQMKDMRFVPVPTKPGDAVFFDSYAPHCSGPNLTNTRRRVLYVTYNRHSEGDHRIEYYADKRKSYPPDCEREPDKVYVFRV